MQGFLAEGLQRTAAGLGSVIIDSQPLSVAILAALFLGERLSPLAVLGLLTGAAGLCLLELPPAVLTDLPGALQGRRRQNVCLQVKTAPASGLIRSAWPLTVPAWSFTVPGGPASRAEAISAPSSQAQVFEAQPRAAQAAR